MPLSGPQWVSQFPDSASVDNLADPFKGCVRKFLATLASAGCLVSISSTRRPVERAYLMHFSFLIAREAANPANVPAQAGVNIQWLHQTPQGAPDLGASHRAAEQMVRAYNIAFRPALKSRQTEGNAIDMNISWSQAKLTIADGNGRIAEITSSPRDGAGNTDLHRVGETYQVIKLASDPPHWSSDGH